MPALNEAQLHREAASRKTREPAILSAQENARPPHTLDNTVVAVEDLGGVSNTMSHGRWNRGGFRPVAHPLHITEWRAGGCRKLSKHLATLPHVRFQGFASRS